jgi:hypothetical protein
MQINQQVRDLEISGFENSQRTFQMKQSPAAFKIISDKIYSNKILAVVREYGCNAYDAHVAAGNQDKPFYVHIPNSLEPYFSIRDYGTGLSEENIYNVYTTYFNSTKSNSNDFIGALGLGSKSAFSYVDQFSIESYFEGTKTTYSCFLDEAGSPSVTKVIEEETTEPNGLCIMVMVNYGDFNNFVRCCRTVFHRFPVLPEFSQPDVLAQYERNVLSRGTNYEIVDYKTRDTVGLQVSCAYAIQGVVAYPIRDENFSEELSDIHQSFLNDRLDIQFPIGQLDIAPSREELSYDKNTQKNILKALDKIIEEFEQHVQENLSKCKNIWEAKLYVSELQHNSRIFSSYIYDIRKTNATKVSSINFNGIPLTDLVNTEPLNLYSGSRLYTDPNTLLVTKKEYPTLTNFGAVPDKATLELEDEGMTFYGYCTHFDSRELQTQKTPSDGYSLIVKLGEVRRRRDVVIIVDEPDVTKRQAFLTAKHNFENVKLANSVELCHAHCVFPFSEADKNALLQSLEGYPYVELFSTLEKPPVVEKTISERANSVVRTGYSVRLDGSYSPENITRYGHSPLSFRDKTFEPNDSGFYCVLYNSELAAHDGISKDDLEYLLLIAKSIGILPENLYGFNSSKLPKSLAKNPNWTNIFDHIIPEIKKYQKYAVETLPYKMAIESVINKERYLRELNISGQTQGNLRQLNDLVVEVRKYSPKSPLAEFAERFVTIFKAASIRYGTIDSFCGHSVASISSRLNRLQNILKLKYDDNALTAKSNKLKETIYGSKKLQSLEDIYPFIGAVASTYGGFNTYTGRISLQYLVLSSERNKKLIKEIYNTSGVSN